MNENNFSDNKTGLDENLFNSKKEKAQEIFARQKTIYNPYFKKDVILNSEGFNHLQFSKNHARNKNEQLLKFRLLPLALTTIKNAGTIQEYRNLLMPIGKPAARDGAVKMKAVEYWGLVAIVGENKIKIKTILRRVGDGNITFWSVMPYAKIKNGRQKLFSEGLGDE
jgi:hypothetical protein